MPMRPNPRRGALALALASLVVPAAITAAPAQAAPSAGASSEKLQKAVTLDGTLRHLRAFQQIADSNGGNRVAGSSGYNASAAYVAGQLIAAGYDVEYDPFQFPFFTENADAVLERTAPEAKAYVLTEDFLTMTYSGSGDVTAAVQPVDVAFDAGLPANSSTSGCEPEDFAGFTTGNIALVQRGTCPFSDKATNAEAAGAVGVIVANEGQEGRTEAVAGTLGGPGVAVPVVGASSAVGEELTAAGTVVRLVTDTTSEIRETYNVIAETRNGRTDNVVMSGAHLDSVAEGPGINDNGSGSGAQLEVAIQFAKYDKKKLANQVRFVWWSAEEFGLLGAEDYVAELTGAELGDIALYTNFDMVASPNYATFLYDGDDSDAEGVGPGPEGSAAIEALFVDHFAAKGLPTKGTDFDGRSDYGPFIAAGIPAGGIFTGAEGIKTEEEAALFGGTAGVAYDPCYHLACDTSRNISNTALDQNADAIAHVIATYAADTSTVNDRTARMQGLAAATEVPREVIEQFSHEDLR